MKERRLLANKIPHDVLRSVSFLDMYYLPFVDIVVISHCASRMSMDLTGELILN
jgi:hypothetical protein